MARPVSSITITGSPFLPEEKVAEIIKMTTGYQVSISQGYMNCFECPLHAMPKTCGLHHLDCLLGSGTKIPKGYEGLTVNSS